MNKITPGHIVSIIFLLAYALITALALYFLSNGDTSKSIWIPVAIGTAMLLLVILLRSIKTARQNFQRNLVFEIIVLAIYIVVALYSFSQFSHAFTVIDRKFEIENKSRNGIVNIKTMFATYEGHVRKRVKAYDERLQELVKNRRIYPEAYHKAGFDGNDDDGQRNRFVENFTDNLLPPAFNDTSKAAITWLDDAKKSVNGWNLIKLVKIVNDIDTRAKAWKVSLIKFDSKREEAIEVDGGPFDYPLVLDNASKLITEPGERPAIKSILAGLFFNLLILLPYIAARRNPRNDGLIGMFKSKGESPNPGVEL